MAPTETRRTLWFSLAGSLAGFFLFQPLVVLVYNLAPATWHEFGDIALWKRLLEMSTTSTSLFMGTVFALFGGASGWYFGSWLEHRERLAAERLESARRLAALETLKELMVTLAHYIRNANMVIGGFGGQLGRHLDDPRQQERLAHIIQASREIEAVIDSLEHLTELSTTQYVASGSARLIDLKEELEKRLGGAKQ
ncbi:MAG: hypothetical protein FJ128_09350 [Deltaproteobacteria bacterium]|nr:hypothetical protein [Deltaproteobacteria bacterium]